VYEGEFNECSLNTLSPETTALLKYLFFLAHTVTEHVNDLARGNAMSTETSKNMEAYSIATDQSTDIKDNVQVAGFIRGVNEDSQLI